MIPVKLWIYEVWRITLGSDAAVLSSLPFTLFVCVKTARMRSSDEENETGAASDSSMSLKSFNSRGNSDASESDNVDSGSESDSSENVEPQVDGRGDRYRNIDDGRENRDRPRPNVLPQFHEQSGPKQPLPTGTAEPIDYFQKFISEDFINHLIELCHAYGSRVVGDGTTWNRRWTKPIFSLTIQFHMVTF